MHEADFTTEALRPVEPSLPIAFAQVGIMHEPSQFISRIPSLVQCFYDALNRFGRIHLSAVQVTVLDIPLPTVGGLDNLVSPLNWFNNAAAARVSGLITFDGDTARLVGQDPLVNLRDFPYSRFVFGPAVSDHADPNKPSQGVLVDMPDWTPGAIGWVLAAGAFAVITGAAQLANTTIRVTRADEFGRGDQESPGCGANGNK